MSLFSFGAYKVLLPSYTKAVYIIPQKTAMRIDWITPKHSCGGRGVRIKVSLFIN